MLNVGSRIWKPSVNGSCARARAIASLIGD
jgi:hypothetical protein